MDTLNLEEVFVRINRFLNENCLDGSWNAKKDDVLEVVIIHRTCASRGSKQQHVVKIEREIHVDANGALEGLPVDGKDGSPSLHPLPPPYPLPLPLSIPLLPGAPLVNRKYEDRGAASQRQPWLECSVDDEVKVFGGNEATGAEEKADPSFNGAAKKLTTTTTKSVDEESAPRTKGRPLTLPELKRNEDCIIECPLCDETFERAPLALNHHLKVHKKLAFPCKKCPREFYDIPSLKFHEDIIHNDGKGELVCLQCGMRFRHASGIKYHVKRLHSDRDQIDDGGGGATKPKLKCSVKCCGKTFDLHLDKRAHLFAAHHDEIKNCQVCKRPFTSEKYLFAHIKTTHIKTTHDNAPLHKCKYCDKAYALEESLSYHCDEEHEDEDVGPRQFICPVSKCLKRTRGSDPRTRPPPSHRDSRRGGGGAQKCGSDGARGGGGDGVRAAGGGCSGGGGNEIRPDGSCGGDSQDMDLDDRQPPPQIPWDQQIYNPPDYNLVPQNARFFVIKSYSEMDVQKSIKHGIWCSTEHGNRKLDQAYRVQKGRGPVLLFFSVNGSGEFCGMAEMTGVVNYRTYAGIWSDPKWKGKFDVNWIYIKNVPNHQLKHIRLENNEYKPVTSSRDTQEVPPIQAKRMLYILDHYKNTASMLDLMVTPNYGSGSGSGGGGGGGNRPR